MGYDPFLPISLAQVNVLCVPAEKISAQKFEEFLRAFRAFSVISLKNVSNSSSFSRYRDGNVLLRITKDTYQDGSDKLDTADINTKPQIVIGLIDGELLPSNFSDDYEQWLESTLTTFRQKSATLNDAAALSLVVLGGHQIPAIDDSYFVDLEGDGPSLLDVIQQIVSNFQTRLEAIAEGLEGLPPDTSQNNNDSRLPSVNASESIKDPRIRMDSPTAGSGLNGADGSKHDDSTVRGTILLGQLYLQAGQWPEALRLFSAGAIAARDDAHYYCYAKALEGLLVCMLLFAWNHLDFNIPQICYPTTDRKGPVYSSPSMGAICTANRSASESLSTGRSISSAHVLTLLTPHLLNTIISLYEISAGILQNSMMFNLLSQARIRWGNLLLVVRKHGGVLRDAALQNLIEEENPGSAGKPQESSATTLVLHVKALTKFFTDAAFEAQSKLSFQQAAQVQVAVASSLSLLGVERKQAFHLRDFLQKLGPALIEARRIGAAEVGVHPSANLPPMDFSFNCSNGAARSGIQALLDSVCESYGMPKSRTKVSESIPSPQDELRKALHLWSAARQAGDIMMKIDILSLCIEVSDAIPDLQCSLNFMARLLQVSIGKVTLSAHSSNPASLISSSDQSRLLHNMRRAVSTADRYGLSDARARYWDKCLVRFIEVSDEPGSSRPILRTARDLSLASVAKNETRKDPFIFNPFAKAKSGVGESVVVVGEQARFNVVLQNPLQIDVEIEDIMLISEGCEFVPDHHSIVLGPLCSQAFTLTGKARKEGALLITGCKATIRGCHPEEFVIVQGDWKPPQAIKHTAVSSTSELLQEVALPDIGQLSLKATAPLPKVSIVSTSMIQQSLMLLEGEASTFSLTLRNDSDIDIDFVLLTFENSVTRRLEEALNNKDMLPADLYEIQNQIATRPVVKWADTKECRENVRIAAQETANFRLEVFGRPGLTDITIVIDYACLGKPREEIQDFYTRQLRHTVTTTINGSIDIPRCSVLPLEGNLLSNFKGLSGQGHQNMPSSAQETTWGENNQCMLLLDVRNIWPQPLEVEFQARPPSAGFVDGADTRTDYCTVTEMLQPGQMTRLLLLAPRILITDPYAPIPSLDTNRQFVVSVSKMTIEAEAASRESFWYRERLLSCLKGTWKEHGGSREGQVDMRKGIRLSSRMIDALRIDLVEIRFLLKTMRMTAMEIQPDVTSITQLGDTHFSLPRNTFASLVTKVHNRSMEELRLLLRLQPSLRNQPHNVALDLSKRFAWTGVLQKALHPPLKPDEIREVELGVIALSVGEYEINGTAEEIRNRSAGLDSIPLELGSGAERRIWHAQRPCSIDATDEKS